MAKQTVHSLLLLHLALRIGSASPAVEKKAPGAPRLPGPVGPLGRSPAPPGQMALPSPHPVLLNKPLSVAVAAVKAQAKKARDDSVWEFP